MQKQRAHPLAPTLDATWQELNTCRDSLLTAPASVEPLHELRVAWRRLRVVLDVLRRQPAFAGLAQAVKEEGRPLAELSSPLRDVDVLSAELTVWCTSEPALAPLPEYLLESRAQKVLPLLQFLTHHWGTVTRAVTALHHALAAADLAEDAHWRRPILRRCERRVQRALEACIAAPDAEDWHRLRIRCKQWRYTLEIMKGGAQSKKLQRLRGLQQCLGTAQDDATFTRLLQDLALCPLPPECLLAIGRQQVKLEQQRVALLNKARRKLKKLLAD